MKKGDLSIDFRLLRMACIRSSLCEPRGSLADLRALNDADTAKKVVEIAEKLIDRGFVNIEAHATVVQAYTKLNDPAKAKFHLDVTTALIRSIMNSGDGKTKESAFEVICDREEYDTLAALGLPYFGPTVTWVGGLKDGPHTFEKFQVQNPKTGQNVTVFFNIDNFSPLKSRPTGKYD